MLNNQTIRPLFSLVCSQTLEEPLYQTLKQWVAEEEDYIDDNYYELNEEIRSNNPDNEEMQKQLL